MKGLKVFQSCKPGYNHLPLLVDRCPRNYIPCDPFHCLSLRNINYSQNTIEMSAEFITSTIAVSVITRRQTYTFPNYE